MLVMRHKALRTRDEQEDPEAGVALVVVVIVMLVGFVIASTIAASVLFTISANQGNKGRTQAFIAAESGRDQLRANLVRANTNGTCSSATLSVGVASQYQTDARAVSSTTPPTSFDSSLPASCPNPTTTFIVIQSTGYGADGSRTTILSSYNWQVVSHAAPGGTMAYFGTSFHTVGTGSSYNGDIVVRTGSFTCSNTNSVDGDLWVVGGADGTNGGNVTLSTGCVVTGNVYAAGTVSSSSSGVSIGKSIISVGGITMDSNGVTVGNGCVAADGAACGQVYSGAAVNLKGTGSSTGTVKGSVTGATLPTISVKWTHPNLTPLSGTVSTAAPPFPVPLNSSQNGGLTAGTVYAMTNWIELGASTSWGTATTVPCPSNPSAIMSAATGPLIFDYTGSTCNVSNSKTNITLSGGNVPQNAVFLVRPSYQMNITVSGALSGPSARSSIFFIHQDSNVADGVPDCGNGNQNDSLTISSGATSIAPYLMTYTPCGFTGTFNQSFTGQMYAAGATTFSGTFTCHDMSWAPTPLPNLACSVLSASGVGGTTYSQTLGGLVSQVEG